MTRILRFLVVASLCGVAFAFGWWMIERAEERAGRLVVVEGRNGR